MGEIFSILHATNHKSLALTSASCYGLILQKGDACVNYKISNFETNFININ